MHDSSRGSGRSRGLIIATAVALGFVLLPLCVTAGAETGAGGSGLPEKIDIRLKSGEVIEGATYLVDRRFEVLKLTLDGGRTRSVSFSAIAT